MIISRVRHVENFDGAAIWSWLRQFKNDHYASRKIIELHDPPPDQRKNVEKQARQIGYCVAQAEEYFSAARHAGLATRPLLTYYGTLSLILAEVLMKQDGSSSLDAARDENRHHGLQLKLDASPSKLTELSKSAAALRAKPHQNDGKLSGTFHLWHKSAREIPIVGEISIIEKGITGTREIGSVATPDDLPFDQIPAEGLTLFDCLRNLPAVHHLLHGYGISSSLVRADATLLIDKERKRTRFNLMLHPASQDAMKAVEDKVYVADEAKDVVKKESFKSGFSLKIDTPFDFNKPGSFKLPSSMQQRAERFFFSPQNYLNEIGYYYVSMFILGTYCRYYPDYWMSDINNHSDLATISNELIESALSRVPALAYSELSRDYLCQCSKIF